MKSGSLSPLSRKAEALLAAERDIVQQPDLVRRRAQLRARTALWQARHQSSEGSGLLLFWRRLRLVLAGGLLATTGTAAWWSLAPGEPQEVPALGTRDADPKPASASPPVRRSPPSPSAERGEPGVTRAPEQDHTPLVGSVKRPARSTPERTSRQEPSARIEELSLLDRARRAVVSGKFQTALKLLERHERLFPRGQLSEERAALRVRALEGAGLSKQADRAASEFESSYPNSVLAPQMNENKQAPP